MRFFPAVVFGAWSLFALLAPAAGAYTPSPTDWRDIPIYQIFTDRFYDGDPANNDAEGSYDPGSASGPSSTWSAGNVHGGDFAGVMDKLDYIQAMGFRAVWISPVQLNVNGEYHGYAARDFKAIAPHFGTEIELRALADALHARGMYLILDIVCNHTGDMITSDTPGYPTYHADPSPYVLQWRSSKRPAPPFDDLSWYHNNGEIQDWVDPEQILGEIFGLDDLRTEDPQVEAALTDAFRWLVDASDCDGFRVDTVKHVDMGFWQSWAPAMHAHADSLGKNDFFMFGEVYDGSDTKCGSYTGTMAGGAYALDSVLYYPMHFTMRDVFAYDQPTDRITDRYANLTEYDPTSRERLVYFLDNHDVSRFLSSGVANGDATRLHAALDFMLTTRGVPCVYQGTEQGFDGGGDPYDREDMWDGAWEYGPSLGDNFNMTHPLYRWVRELLDIRSRYEALRTGGFTVLADEPGPGIYAYLRTDPSEDVLVAVNSSDASRTSGVLSTNWPSGTVLADLRDSTFTATVGGGGNVFMTVPARRALILVRDEAVTASAPAVNTQDPAHADTVSELRPAIRLAFNRSMNPASVEAAFDLSPSVAGSFTWEADTAVTFLPSADLAEGARYELRVEPTATASDGTPLRAAFETFFVSGGGVPGVTVAAGFHASIFADGSAVGVPEGIALGEGGAWGDDFYVGDAGGNRILRVSATGTVSVFTADALLQKPEGLDFDHGGTYGGDLLVADQSGLLRVGSDGTVTQITSGTSSTNAGAIACLPPGPFGGFPYLGSHVSNRVERYELGTGYVPFASPVDGFEGVTEGVGAFGAGERLLVANPNLTAYASDIDGDGSVLQVDSTGAITTLVQDPTLLGGVSALIVDVGGNFGGELLAANVATESVLRVSPEGAVSVLASGFGNLFGSDCLVIGGDGALYVVDTGSGEPFTDTSGGTAPARILRIAADNPVGTTGVALPARPLVRVYPNPLSGTGRVALYLEREADVVLELFDVTGRRVASPFSGRLPAGGTEVPLDLRSRPLSRGVYFLRVRLDGRQLASTRIVLQGR